MALETNIYGYFNFIFKDGTRTRQDFKDQPIELKALPADSVVRRIDLYSEELEGYGNRLNCVMFYDRHA